MWEFHNRALSNNTFGRKALVLGESLRSSSKLGAPGTAKLSRATLSDTFWAHSRMFARRVCFWRGPSITQLSDDDLNDHSSGRLRYGHVAR